MPSCDLRVGSTGRSELFNYRFSSTGFGCRSKPVRCCSSLHQTHEFQRVECLANQSLKSSVASRRPLLRNLHLCLRPQRGLTYLREYANLNLLCLSCSNAISVSRDGWRDGCARSRTLTTTCPLFARVSSFRN